VITRIGDLAVALGGELESLEVNPLWVNGGTIEALDAVVNLEPEMTKGARLLSTSRPASHHPPAS